MKKLFFVLFLFLNLGALIAQNTLPKVEIQQYKKTIPVLHQ